MSDGNVSLILIDSLPSDAGHLATVGEPVDGGFEDLVTVSTSRQFEGGDGWVEGTYGGFPTLVRDEEFATWTTQDRGDWWISVVSGPDRVDAVHDVLDHVDVDSSGQITIDATSTRVLVETFPLTRTAGLVIFPGSSLDRVEPTTINGVRAWRLIPGEDPPVSDTTDPMFRLRAGVQWQFSPNRSVLVGGDVDADTIERFAASLTEVPPAQWASALPGYKSECTLDPQRCSELLPELPAP